MELPLLELRSPINHLSLWCINFTWTIPIGCTVKWQSSRGDITVKFDCYKLVDQPVSLMISAFQIWHLVLWWTGITRWWMFTLQHRWRSNLIVCNLSIKDSPCGTHLKTKLEVFPDRWRLSDYSPNHRLSHTCCPRHWWMFMWWVSSRQPKTVRLLP